jgi:hypothetical protein
MNSTAEKIETKEVRQVSVNGYIDAIANNRIYGWAWDAQKPDARITVRLQAGGNTVGIIAADLPREDLKANGIGDGAHAFEAALPDGISPNELSLLAVCPDTGQTVELSPRAVAPQSSGGHDLRSAIETLAKSHGFMHRKLQTMAAAMEESRRNGAPESASSVQSPSEEFAPMSRLQSLEEAVLRLDALVKQQEATIEVLRNRPTDPMPRLLAAAAAVLSVAALLIAIMQ